MTNFIAKTLPRYFMIILIFVQCSNFNSTEELVVKICGVETYNSENIEIPENTIFPVDINFWIECRHYVSGGWIYYDMGSQISINSVSLYKASGYLWIIFLPILLYVYWRTVEKN